MGYTFTMANHEVSTPSSTVFPVLAGTISVLTVNKHFSIPIDPKFGLVGEAAVRQTQN